MSAVQLEGVSTWVRGLDPYVVWPFIGYAVGNDVLFGVWGGRPWESCMVWVSSSDTVTDPVQNAFLALRPAGDPVRIALVRVIGSGVRADIEEHRASRRGGPSSGAC